MNNATRRPLFLLVAAICAWGVILACSSSDDNSPSKTPAGNNATANGQATATSVQSNEFAEAGPELSAYHLLDASGYAAALGEQVSAVEDDGVVPASFGCEQGQARVAITGGAILTVKLFTATDANEAAQVYQGYAHFEGTPTPISAAGDEAAYLAGLALVRKGSQVLEVRAQPGPEAQTQLDNIKINGGDPRPAQEAMLAAAGKAAPALAGKMSGQACNGPALGIPAGALKPCPGKVSDLEAALGITGVTATPRISDLTGFQQCEYDLGADGIVSVYTATGQQLQAAAPPLVAADVFAKAQASATSRSGTYETFSNTQFKMFGSTTQKVGIDTNLLFQPSGASTQNMRNSAIRAVSYVGTTDPMLQVLMLHFLQSSSGLRFLGRVRCQALVAFLIREVMNEYVADNATVEYVVEQYDEAIRKGKDWCVKVAPTPVP